MYIKTLLFLSCVMILSFPTKAKAEKHKDDAQRGMLEKMEAVPCGAKQRGLSGLGSVFASAGVEHVNSNEKLCPQYLLRTDTMEYHIRPTDGKHPVVLPIGKEGVFKIKNDHMFLRVPDGDRKERTYEVVAENPVNGGAATPNESAKVPDKPQEKQ